MWANAQCDGRPAEYRWRPLLNAAVWLTPTSPVPWSNAANIRERKTWMQIEYCTWQNPLCGKSRRKCIYSVPAQETAKHHAKFGWLPLSDVAAVMKPRSETRWNLLACPKLVNQPQPLVGRRSPYCEDMWMRYSCLTIFFPIVDTCLSCEDIARQSCAMVPRWQIFGDSLCPVFSASRVQHISDLYSKFTLRPHHVWKYGRHPMCGRWDRRGKKKENR